MRCDLFQYVKMIPPFISSRLREASLIDFVHEKRHMDVLLETPTHTLPYKIIIAKLVALNVLSIVLYTFKNFNNIYILQNYLSWHALKIKSTQIMFKQETHSTIM